MSPQDDAWFRRGKWRRRLLLLTASLFVSIALAEVIVRVAGLAPAIDPHMGWLVEDEYLPYKPVPHSRIQGRVGTGEYQYDHSYNSLGFRDTEHEVGKPPATFRIVGLGDSFTAGWGASFEETYLRRVEVALAKRTGEHPNVEVIKAGINGYFPATEKLVLQHYGLRYSPDLVVVGFLPNDVLDTVRGVEALVVSKQGFLTSAEAADLGEAGLWLYRTSCLARIVLRWYVASLQEQRPADSWKRIYNPTPRFEEAWRQLERDYEEILAMTRAADAKLVVLHIPETVPNSTLLRYPAVRLAAWCRQHGVCFVDASPKMLAAATADDTPLYFPQDRHCTPRGYGVVADALLAGLLSAKLIP